MKKLFILLLAVSATCCRPEAGATQDMKIIAHRGGRSLGPENTLSCINAGIESGADLVEIDVHMTSDGRVVVCHDETVDRTTDGKGKIEEMTFEQVSRLSIEGSEHVPTLEEVLEAVNGRCGLLIEVKRKHEGQYPLIEDKVLELVDSFGMRDRVVFQSFDDEAVVRFHEIAPDVPVLKLLFCRLPFGIVADGRLHSFKFEDYDFVAGFNACNSLIGKKFIRDVQAMGKKVVLWTVNDPRKVPDGVCAVVTDCPQEFVR